MSLLVAAGCARYVDRNVPEPIRPGVEPEWGRPYELYRPSSYDRHRAWPLIIVGHSSFPDSANRQIRAWDRLAEAHGFIVLAPVLESSSKSSSRRAADQLERLRRDEKHILASLRHVRAGHNISEDRIFLYGWGRGTHAALHTGLRHPEVFRAVAVMQPEYEPGYLTDAGDQIDNYQPVFVDYCTSDVLRRKDGRDLADWLRAHGAEVWEDSTCPVRRTECRRVIDFLENVIRKEPWITIRAWSTGRENPLEMQFKLQCSHTPTQFRWEFGDGDEAVVAQPIHAYARPGASRVMVTIDGPDGRTHTRTLDLTVPLP